MEKINWRNVLIYIAIVILVIMLVAPLVSPPAKVAELSFSDFLNQVDKNNIKEVAIQGENISGKLKDNTAFKTRSFNYPNLIPALREKNINIKVEAPVESSWFWNLVIQILAPIAFFALLWWLLIRQAQSTNAQAMAFGRSTTKPLKGKVNVTFKDVAGVDEAKEELKEIVEFLKTPEKFQALGARIPKGLLLMGAPGTGKTLLARAIAGEAGVPFFSISGSDFVEMFVGVGASVTGDTPVLIRKKDKTELLPISQFVDNYYEDQKEGYVVPINDVETLGFEGKSSDNYSSHDKFFGKSEWKNVKAVYRHRVDKIYEIHYLGGAIKTTADHSIFIREGNRLLVKKASELKTGDILVNLPFKVRGRFLAGLGTLHHLRAHSFPAKCEIKLEMWDELPQHFNELAYAVTNAGKLSTQTIASQIGVSNCTVLNWQNEKYAPAYLSRKLKYPNLPEEVPVTPQLMKLFGYYTAEGRSTGHLEFVLGAHEKEYINEVTQLMRQVFEVEPHLEYTTDNSVRIKYHIAPLAHFFERYCGNGSHNKHVPEFTWNLPYNHFIAYLEGWSNGDGYISTENKLSITSVSYQLILEMNWLCAMHGIKTGPRHQRQKGGRVLKTKPLPEGEYWNLIIGKTANPFTEEGKTSPNQTKKPRIKKIVVKEYNGFVYDFCGCENEAFFGGEKPVLLHNSRVRSLFQEAKKQTPCIIFMDEIDAVGRHRGAGLGGGHDEREQTLNQLLVEMDGFDPKTNIIVIAATNRPDILDPALLRPGRFDRQVVLDKPDLKGREEILNIHSKDKPLAKDVDLKILARRTPGFTGADLENLMNEGAILAARADKKEVGMAELEEAVDRVLAGPEKKSRIISDKEKEIVAYHEVGHALLSKLLPKADPVHKISILPRGLALGYTLQLPVEDKHLISKSEALEKIVVLLGGRVAEEMTFNEVTSGAHNDLERATEIAKSMVCEYGMSALGPRTFGRRDRQIFLGRDIAEMKDYSEQTADAIDKEVEKIVEECHQEASALLTKNKGKLEEVAKKLREKETLEGEELEVLFKDLHAETA